MDVLLSERTKIIGKTWTPMNLGVLAVLALLLRAHVFPRFLRGSWMSWILVIKNINYNISKNFNNIYYKTFTAKEC